MGTSTGKRSRMMAAAAALAVFACGAVLALSFAPHPVAGSYEPVTDDLTEYTEPGEAQNWSRFPHSTAQHARMPCLLCHVRNDNSPTPKRSGHIPCASCHVQEFADPGHAICTICHTNASTGALKRFPPLRSFNVRFDHARHQRLASCASCHRPAQRGRAFSIPAGFAAHTTCYSCHGPRTQSGGRNTGSCGVCHQPGRPNRPAQTSHAYAVNFSHQEHTGRGRMQCSACHTIRPRAARGRQVTEPTAAMHFAPAGTQSCASCHNDRRAFGANDFSNCKKCHEGKTFRF